MDGYSHAGFLSHGKSSRAGMTRRDVLRGLAAGSTALAGAPLLSAYGIGAGGVTAAPARTLGQTVDVTLITAEDLPYPGIPTADEQAADPGLKAYAEAIQPWLDENPGVKLEQITFDVYDQEALLVAISGGTAPSFYPADVLGEWDEELVLASEKSGLAADVTDQIAQNDLEAKLADYCLALWKTKEVEGRHYALPYGYNCGDGIHYRIDLIKEAGLEEPTVDWTW
jgi:ABC-type glycerol-3-phosphate transport system substrate-binding protein